MKVAKSSLVAMLLEVGEENAAVLLARSQLPDEVRRHLRLPLTRC